MKKLFSICLVCLAIAGLLTGCGKSLEADRDTVYVQKKGTVTSAAISDFDKDYYDEEELKKLIKVVYQQIKTLDFIENPELNLAANKDCGLKGLIGFVQKLLDITIVSE